MAYISQYEYYENNGNTPEDANWGSYQYVSLYDIVNNFMLMYAGNHSLINNEERFKVLFHAKRGIQELNYDAFKEIKILQLTVCNTLRYVLPPDYVNWVRVSMYKNGLLYPLTENIQTNWSGAYLQDNNCPFNGYEGYCCDGMWYFDYAIGARFGLNTETANANPTFSINKKGGVINFSSDMANESIVLEYVSDGMENGDNTEISVNKMFEDYIYAYIEYAILSSKLNVQEYVIARARKRKSSLLRNAKIRISNIHPGRLLMNLRGQNKWLK